MELVRPSASRRFTVLDHSESSQYDGFGENRKTANEQHLDSVWTNACNIVLALLLLSNSALLGASRFNHSLADSVLAILVVICEAMAILPAMKFARIGTMLSALCLLLVPLVFHVNDAGSYLVDTYSGALFLVFALIIPGLPGPGGREIEGADIPPGWSYNPSSWIRRWLGIALALTGFLLARYMTAFQLGLIDHVYDPFFAHGSEHVLHSALSKSFPVSDAGLGAVVYLLEMLGGFMGGRARWRAAPWAVVLFTLLVIPLGVTSMVLLVLQPILVGSWCGLCLIASVAVLIAVPLAVHELVAVGQFLYVAKSQGKSLWSIFWRGGQIIGAGQRDPDRQNYSIWQKWVASVQGVNVPYTLFVQIALGICLLVRPDLFPSNHLLDNWDHILGALAVTVAAVACAEVTRMARFANVLTGLALIGVSAYIYAFSQNIFGLEFLIGVLLIVLSFPRGQVSETYGDWDEYVK